MLKIRNFGQKSVISTMVFATSRKWHGMQRCVLQGSKMKLLNGLENNYLLFHFEEILLPCGLKTISDSEPLY